MDECQPPMIHQRASEDLSKNTSPALRKAIHDELLDIIKDGVDIPNLQMLHRFANTAQELLMVRSPLAEVRTRKRKRLGSLGYNTGVIDGENPYQTLYGFECSSEDVSPALTEEASPNETLGTKMVKELVSALSANKRAEGEEGKSNAPDVFEGLVIAIKRARDEGMPEIAARLEKKLDGLLKLNEAIEETAEEKPLDPQNFDRHDWLPPDANFDGKPINDEEVTAP